MRKIVWISGIAVLILLPIIDSWSEGLEFGIEPRGWWTELDGDVKISTSGTPGTRINFESDLGIDATADIPDGEIWIKWGKNKLALSYFEIEHEGSKVITQPITYNGYPYTITQRVDSEFDTRQAELDYIRTLVKVEENELGFLLGVKYISFEGTLKSVGLPAPGIERSEDFDVPVPVLGLNGKLTLVPWLSLRGGIKGISVNAQDTEATLIDVHGIVEITLTKNISINGGYRYIDLEGDHEDDEANWTLQGPTVGALVTF